MNKPRAAGRPAMNPAERKQMMSFKISPELVEYLKTASNKTAAIEKALRDSPEFKVWQWVESYAAND